MCKYDSSIDSARRGLLSTQFQLDSSAGLASNNLYHPDFSGVIALADVIKDMRALSILSLKSDNLANKEGGKALVQALANNTVLKELDVSSNNWQLLQLQVPRRWQGDGP